VAWFGGAGSPPRPRPSPGGHPMACWGQLLTEVHAVRRTLDKRIFFARAAIASRGACMQLLRHCTGASEKQHCNAAAGRMAPQALGMAE